MSSLQQVILDQARHATERDCHKAIEIWQQRLRELQRNPKLGECDMSCPSNPDGYHLADCAALLPAKTRLLGGF